MKEEHAFDQKALIEIVSAKPQNFAWFLGAGASRSAGLPSATDLLWDLKRHYYCREENQEITRQDIQNDAVRHRIQSFMESRGFPAEWADNEYEAYFEKLFGKEVLEVGVEHEPLVSVRRGVRDNRKVPLKAVCQSALTSGAGLFQLNMNVQKKISQLCLNHLQARLGGRD